MTELRACLHCGGEAGFMSERLSSTVVMWKVICDTYECYAQTDGYFANEVQTEAEAKQKALAAWNRRTPDWEALARDMAAELSGLLESDYTGMGGPIGPGKHIAILLARAKAAGLEV